MRPLLQRRLDQVSRSFALCIPQLESPFQDRVALAYLLFRVLDTVEDAPFTDRVLQQSQFAAMRNFLRVAPTAGELARFIEAFPPQITAGERALLGDTGMLFEDAYALPPAVRKAMFYAMDRMALGMAAYARRPMPLCLVDLEDVTRYCCFVAGLVGEMLTELWAFDSSAPARGSRSRTTSACSCRRSTSSRIRTRTRQLAGSWSPITRRCVRAWPPTRTVHSRTSRPCLRASAAIARSVRGR